ncbi:mycofactocin biosynthesis chaperone MftB [Kineosporia sp. A_224]|uniref:mycofactocin biosynthesis chaperone MftB n=1 Tax=Kineosporia sp. A_224 TaxID=1962180 RepID=UPI000B4AD94A|nr:mycofactocin biosynthesis chaperone MftB [Kineosporia sp. A_224]
MGFDLDAAWRLHTQVAVRPEPFGALLYHFGTRRLSFLKDPLLTDAVRSLPDHATARAACVAVGVPDPVPADVAGALETLAQTGMIVRRDPS